MQWQNFNGTTIDYADDIGCWRVSLNLYLKKKIIIKNGIRLKNSSINIDGLDDT